jgi:hypothetical protein
MHVQQPTLIIDNPQMRLWFTAEKRQQFAWISLLLFSSPAAVFEMSFLKEKV